MRATKESNSGVGREIPDSAEPAETPIYDELVRALAKANVDINGGAPEATPTSEDG